MDKKGKQQFIIKVCCVIAAFALWLFITSTENPVTTYKLKNVPVQLLNTDSLARSNLILVPGQDLTIDLNIKGANTSTLLNKKAEEFTIVADLGVYALKNGDQKIPIELRKSPDNVNVENSDTLFVKISLDELTENELPITVNVSGKPKEGFYVSEPKLSQESATVIGGKKFVNLVKNIIINKDIDGLDSDVIKNYDLKPVDAAGKEVNNVVVNPSHIDVKIPIRKTKSVGITVKTIGKLNSSFTLTKESMRVLPERFEVTGSEVALDKIDNLDTEAIDLSKINKNTTMDVKVLIPDGISLVSGSDTAKVEINIDKLVQKDVSLDIKYINLDEKYEVKLGKDKDLIVISGNETIINSLDLKKFKAEIDLADLVEGEQTVSVNLTMPQGVKLISEDPGKVLVTITKKQTEVTTSNDNKTN